MADKEKPLEWIGSAKKDLMALPTGVRKFFGHAFQKKSKSGIATPKEDLNVIRARLKIAEALVKELRNGKAHH